MLGQDWPRAGGPVEGATRYFHAFIVKLSGNTVVVNVSHKGCQKTRSIFKAVSKRKRATRAGREAAGGFKPGTSLCIAASDGRGKRAWDPYFATFSGTSSNCRAVLGGGSGPVPSMPFNPPFMSLTVSPVCPLHCPCMSRSFVASHFPTSPVVPIGFPVRLCLQSHVFISVPCMSLSVPFCFPVMSRCFPVMSTSYVLPPISLHFLAFPLCSPIFLAKKHGFPAFS